MARVGGVRDGRRAASDRIVTAGTARRPAAVARAGMATALCLASLRVTADPWIPDAGAGYLEAMARQYVATRAFPPTSFSTATTAASEQRDLMYRATGVHGIGNGLSIEYDLRAGHLEKYRIKHGTAVVNSASGQEDQEVGLNYGLRQRARFADSIAFNYVVPTGSTHSIPALGTGQAAVEPDYQLGVDWRRMTATLKVGPRMFIDGGAAQMRLDMGVGVELLHRMEITGTLFVVRTVHLRSPLTAAEAAENYDLLRPGVKLKYRLNAHFRPFLAYERDVAGKAIHAGRRVSAGLAYEY